MFKLGGPGLPTLLQGDAKEQVGAVFLNMGIADMTAESLQTIRGMVVFTMACDQEAQKVRVARKQLAGSGLVVWDFLSKEEWACFKRLQPAYKQARDQGKSAYFNRARLFVNGEEVQTTGTSQAR